MILGFSYATPHALYLVRAATAYVDAGGEASAACANALRPIVLANRADILQTCARLVNTVPLLSHCPRSAEADRLIDVQSGETLKSSWACPVLGVT